SSHMCPSKSTGLDMRLPFRMTRIVAGGRHDSERTRVNHTFTAAGQNVYMRLLSRKIGNTVMDANAVAEWRLDRDRPGFWRRILQLFARRPRRIEGRCGDSNSGLAVTREEYERVRQCIENPPP